MNPYPCQSSSSLLIVLAEAGDDCWLQPLERRYARLGCLLDPAVGRRTGVLAFGSLLWMIRFSVRVIKLIRRALRSVFVISGRSRGGLVLSAARYCRRLADTKLLMVASGDAKGMGHKGPEPPFQTVDQGTRHWSLRELPLGLLHGHLPRGIRRIGPGLDPGPGLSNARMGGRMMTSVHTSPTDTRQLWTPYSSWK